MALKLGELVAYIKVDKSGFDKGLAEAKAEFHAAGAQLAGEADQTGKQVGEKLGEGGTTGAEKFTRTGTARMRDSRGRFIKEGEDLGDGIGRGLGDGVRNNTGWTSLISDAVKSLGSSFSSAMGFVQSAQNSLGAFASGVSGAVSSVWSLVPALSVLAGVAALTVPAIGLLGGALGSLPALAVGGGAALGVLGLGFMGISDAFKQTASSGAATVDTAHQVAMAERNLSDAQISALQAQDNLNKARVAAKKSIDDLNRSLLDMHLQEEEAALAEKDALAALAQAHRTGTRDQIEHADLAYRRAQQNADDVKAKTNDTEQQQRKATAAGVEGSDQVKQALDQQRKATEGVSDAQYALEQAHKAQTTQATAAAAATTKLAASARELVDVIKQLKPAFEDLRLDIQQRLFAGVGEEVRSLAHVWLPVLHDKLGAFADTFNGLFKNFSTSIKKPEFIAGIEKGLDSVNHLIDQVGGAVSGPLVDAFGRLSGAAGPFLDAVGGEVAQLLTDFSAWIKKADESGALKDFFKKAGDFFHDTIAIGKDVGGIIGDIMGALFSDPKNAKGGSAWESLKKNMDDLRAWFDNPENQKKIQDWFQKLETWGKIFLTVAGWIGDLILWFDKAEKNIDRWVINAGKAIDGFVKGVGTNWDKLVGWVEALPGRISKATSGMWDGIKDSFRSAINWVIGAWNRLSFTLPSVDTHIPGVGKVGGFTLDTPNIPYLADGGVVRATPGGRLAVMGEGGQDEAVIPLDKLAGMLGGRGGASRVVFDTGGDPVLDALFRVIRYKVKADYSGDVTAAFAGG